MDERLIILTVVVLLPVVPAFILFKLLPSRAILKGPLAGLSVSLGGAFGGYIALMVFVTRFYAQHLVGPVMWHVHGTLQFASDGLPPRVLCELRPPELKLDDENTFDFDVPVDDRGPMPRLVFQATGYEPQSVYLSKAALRNREVRPRFDASLGTIFFDDPIVFRKREPAATRMQLDQPQPISADGGHP